MRNPKDVKPISENCSTNEIVRILPVLKVISCIVSSASKIGIKYEPLSDIKNQIDDLVKQSSIIGLPDRFNAAFGKRGWITVGSGISVEVMNSALELHDSGNIKEAEQKLTEWFTKENIEFFAINRARRFHKANLRDEQLREALNLYVEERYMAAVPLVLIACDGFASDVCGLSPFAESADLTVFDSLVGHPTGLPALIGLLKKGAYRSRDDQMNMPERHKIIHGRSLGYANKEVCAKAWLLMMALVEWANDKSSESDRRVEAERKANVSWSDIRSSLRRTEADKQQIEAFVRLEKAGPFGDPFDEAGPEKALFDFLSGWQAGNYGSMAKHAVNLSCKPIKKMAGDLRNMAEFVTLEKFELRKFIYSTVARCDAIVWIKSKNFREAVEGEFKIVLFRYTKDGKIAMPSDRNAYWTVQQNCIYNVMSKSFIEEY
jgi:hypothetical protein